MFMRPVTNGNMIETVGVDYSCGGRPRGLAAQALVNGTSPARTIVKAFSWTIVKAFSWSACAASTIIYPSAASVRLPSLTQIILFTMLKIVVIGTHLAQE